MGVLFCLVISAFCEIAECWVVATSEKTAEALSDTQSEMLPALTGVVGALLVFCGFHDQQPIGVDRYNI
ncbi:hypothetical protein [Kaarinaea lacus]